MWCLILWAAACWFGSVYRLKMYNNLLTKPAYFQRCHTRPQSFMAGQMKTWFREAEAGLVNVWEMELFWPSTYNYVTGNRIEFTLETFRIQFKLKLYLSVAQLRLVLANYFPRDRRGLVIVVSYYFTQLIKYFVLSACFCTK